MPVRWGGRKGLVGRGEREREREKQRDFGYLTVEDVLRCGLLVLHVPHQGHAVRLVRSLLIVVVRGEQEFRILPTERKKEKSPNECRRRGGRRAPQAWLHVEKTRLPCVVLVNALKNE